MKSSRIKDLPCYVQENGRLPVYVGEKLRDLLKELAGKKVYLSLEEDIPQTTCSLAALRYYRGVLLPAARKYRANQGDPVSPEKCHEELLSTFSEYTDIRGFDGVIRSLPKRTHTGDEPLDDKEFYKFCLAVEGFLASEGVVLPAHPKYD